MIANSFQRAFAAGVLGALAMAFCADVRSVHAETAQALPELGNEGHSDDAKHRLGHAWLRLFRSSAETNSDPLLYDYMVHLLYSLAEHSRLRDRRLTLVMVHDKRFNAFAVPGGVVGVHDGLLRYSQAEDELAGVIAHELGHLSQGHFERGQERSQGDTRKALLGLLAGIALLGSNADAGLAAIAASQAAAIESSLRYSRLFEQEADRIAISTLASAGWNPDAVPAIFGRLQRTARFDQDVPEFLRTHPLTASRISDARNHAAQLPRLPNADGDGGALFLLMRERVRRAHRKDPQRAVEAQRDMLRRADGDGARRAALYGLALALADAGQRQQAQRTIAGLLAEEPTHIPFVVAQAEIALSARNYGLATSLLAGHLALNPGNHPLTMRYVDALIAGGGGKAQRAAAILARHVQRHPGLPEVWQRLAEASALAGKPLDSHRARAEGYMLVGALDSAKRQFEYALKRTDSAPTIAKIKRRRKVLRGWRREQERIAGGKG